MHFAERGNLTDEFAVQLDELGIQVVVKNLIDAGAPRRRLGAMSHFAQGGIFENGAKPRGFASGQPRKWRS